MLLDNNEPTSYGEAMVGPDSDKWLGAIKSENGSMDFGGLARWSASHWDKWIFKKKTDVDGNVTVYEARLVAKSFSQVQGVDYDEIFSLVAMLRVCWNYISSYCIIYEILQIGCQNIVSSTIFLRKGYMWYNRKVLSIPKDANKYASSSDPSMDWSKHLGVGMCALTIRWSKILGLYKVYEKLVFPKKWVGAL